MPSLSWLHLTDLHRGLPGQRARWSSVRQAFYDDLSRLAARAGPWDLVLFTGDLTQRGSADEFALLDETLYALFDHLRALGSTPTLVTVPGNHDLARPRVNSVVRALRNWHHDRDLREEFWSTNDGEVHALLRECFSAYDAFAARWPLPPGFAERRGLIPGDRSISLSHNEIRLALVGLNSAFLQLEGGDYQGRLDLDPRQLLGVCGDDPGLFVDDHHLALLLTHHPSDWLHPRALADYRADITPPGRFAAHLFGHMHEPSAQTVAIAGAPAQRAWQGPSLFGLENYGEAAGERVHGYTAGRITRTEHGATATLWPRSASRNLAGAWQIIPDHTRFVLDDNGALHEERFPVRRLRAVTPPPAAAVAPRVPPSPPPSPRGDALPPSNSQTTALRDVRAVLVRLYDSPGSIRRVLHDAAVPTERVIFTGGAEQVWFDALGEAEKHGLIGAVLAIARDEYPANADLLRLLRDPALPSVAREADNTPPNEFSLYEALTRLLPAQFDVVLFRLSVDVSLLPAATAPLADRAIALLRLLKQQGRLRDLTVAIAGVTSGR